MDNTLLKKIFDSFKQLFSGQAIYTIASFISAYFFARLLGPEKYGTWQTAVIFTQYSILFSLGLPFIMRRDFIQLRSEGQLQEAENMANQVFSYSLFAGPLFSIVLIVYAVFFSNDIYFKYALITVAVINLFNVISGYGDIMTKGFNVISGLSVHTLGISVPVAAVALGTKVIEKHFILDKSIGGPDAEFSLDFNEFSAMVKAIRKAEKAIGKVNYKLSEKVRKSRIFCRSLFVVKDIKKGETFTEENVQSIRPGYGLEPKYLKGVLGRVANCDIERGKPLNWDCIC